MIQKIDPIDYGRLEARLREILNADLPDVAASDRGDIQEYIDHGEYGLAFELLCAVLKDVQNPISLAVYEALVQAGVTMGLDSKQWESLPHEVARRP